MGKKQRICKRVNCRRGRDRKRRQREERVQQEKSRCRKGFNVTSHSRESQTGGRGRKIGLM